MSLVKRDKTCNLSKRKKHVSCQKTQKTYHLTKRTKHVNCQKSHNMSLVINAQNNSLNKNEKYFASQNGKKHVNYQDAKTKHDPVMTRKYVTCQKDKNMSRFKTNKTCHLPEPTNWQNLQTQKLGKPHTKLKPKNPLANMHQIIEWNCRRKKANINVLLLLITNL